MINEPRPLIWDDRLGNADKELVTKLNNTLNRLSHLRAIEIAVSGPFARSKIAWKLAYYQQALLHRIVALSDGAAISWNYRCTLSAMLSARAFMETIAVMAELKKSVAKYLATEDLSALDELAQRGLFATRDDEWLKQHPESKATNAITYVEKFDEIVPGFWKHYEMLSERCHPNALGHNYMFAKLDRSDGTVQFTDERELSQNGYIIITALATLPLTESLMSNLDGLILNVADLHHRISPLGGKGSE